MEQQSMKDRFKLEFGEEVANCVTHGVMALLCLFALPCVAVYGYIQAGMLKAIGDAIFVISLFLMFIVSTLYHSMPFGTTHKYVFRKLDHICIYFAIAGSYTPIALTVIGGTKGFVIIAIEWLAVLGGILLKSISSHAFPKLSMAIYMIMGWVAILFIPDLVRGSSILFISLIVAGGLMYTIGAIFYKHPEKKYYHSIWHICINIASIFHFIAIIFLI